MKMSAENISEHTKEDHKKETISSFVFCEGGVVAAVVLFMS
jgi:hypothetical protein